MTDNISLSVPRHLGIILDGNRRYAREHGMTSLQGHQKGYDNLKSILEIGFERGIEYISGYVFSTENWNRTTEEVTYLMDLMLWVFKNELKQIHKKGVRILWLGSTDKLGEKHLRAIRDAVELTKNNKKGTFCLCLNYGGQQEIVDAAKKVIEQGVHAEDLTIDMFEKNLYEPEVPPIDMLVRSSGEHRISNFMLWRAAYSELLFVDKYWPEFTPEDIDMIINEYSQRQRRFGT